MKFDLSNPDDRKLFSFRGKQLVEKRAKVEMKEIRKPRTLNQNSYLHACFALYSIETGYTVEEIKMIVKVDCQFMKYQKNGYWFVRSTASLNTEEMSKFIEHLIFHAGGNGVTIPTADEYLVNSFNINRQIEKAL